MESGEQEFRWSRTLQIRGEPLLTSIQRNFAAGVTVALVNIPLSISLAVASDATPSMGIITAIWAGSPALTHIVPGLLTTLMREKSATGTITAFLGGSHYNIVGPTGTVTLLSPLALCAPSFARHAHIWCRLLQGP